MAEKINSDRLTNHTTSAVRFPQVLTLDFNALRQTFGKDYSLATDLIIYLSQVKRRDLFNKIRFSASDFASTMGYDASNLKRNERQFDQKNLPVLNGHICDGVLEYTLFCMGRYNLSFSGSYKGKFKAEFVQLISNLEIHNHTKPNSKRVYEVTPSDFLLHTMFKEFYVLNIDDYVKAGKLNSRNRNTSGAGKNLYMALIRGMHLALYNKKQGFEPVFDTNVDALSVALGFDMNREPKDRKKAIKNLLEKFKELDHLKFEYSFFSRNNTRIQYDIRIKYPEENIKEYENELETRFYNLFYAFLENKFKDLYPQYVDQTNTFPQWLESQANLDIKVHILQTVHRDVYNVPLDDETAKRYLKSGIKRNSWKLSFEFKEQPSK